jgi:hypothetical protein
VIAYWLVYINVYYSLKQIITETIELAEGTTSFLNCSTIVNGVKVDVYWEIPGITEDGDPYGPEDVILIYNADCNKHSRNYTCFRRAVTSKVVHVLLKRFVVKVIGMTVKPLVTLESDFTTIYIHFPICFKIDCTLYAGV